MKLRKAWEITTPDGGKVIVPATPDIQIHGPKNYYMGLAWIAAGKADSMPEFKMRRIFVLS